MARAEVRSMHARRDDMVTDVLLKRCTGGVELDAGEGGVE